MTVAVNTHVAHHAHDAYEGILKDIDSGGSTDKYLINSLLEYNHVDNLERDKYVSAVMNYIRLKSKHDKIAEALSGLGEKNLKAIYDAYGQEGNHHLYEIIEMYIRMDKPAKDVRKTVMIEAFDHRRARHRKDMTGVNLKKVKKKLCN
ncbi:MAG: hypothetical protein U9Q92_07545 [archaeon]|nr:hypothetical protein [archaeon]